MVIDGADLGAAMTPADVLIAIRQYLELENDEIIAAMRAGADRVEADLLTGAAPAALDMLGVDDRKALVAVARSVTPSRIDAWRRRHRQMTWPEIRILLLGLRLML
jgi:hypothetical protein